MNSVDVRSIQTLIDLKMGLARFGLESQNALQRVGRELRQTQKWLAERKRYWEGQAQRMAEAARQTRETLERCQASGYRDPQTGRVYVPDCSGPEAAHRQALAKLQEAHNHLANVQRSIRMLTEAGERFQRQARRMTAFDEKELLEAQAFLERRASVLESYAAIRLPSHTVHRLTPIQAAQEPFIPGLATDIVELIAVSVIDLMSGSIQQILGALGEALTAGLANQQSDWQEVSFDQPQHGFCRMLMAPDLDLVVLESNLHRSDEHRMQEWVEDQIAPESDPHSTQLSSINQRVTALFEKLDLENLPAVVMVIESAIGQATVHCRTAMDNSWRVLGEAISLEDILHSQQENRADE